MVLSDGLDDVNMPMNSVLSMAGMGGVQMCSILKRAPLHQVSRVILQPNRDAHLVRDYLASVGWYTQDASVVEERGRFFLSWCAQSGNGDIGENRWHWEEHGLRSSFYAGNSDPQDKNRFSVQKISTDCPRL